MQSGQRIPVSIFGHDSKHGRAGCRRRDRPAGAASEKRAASVLFPRTAQAIGFWPIFLACTHHSGA